MVRMLVWAAVSITAFVILLFGVRETGLRNNASYDLAQALSAPDCIQPCWHSIRPSETNLHDAEAILREDANLRINTFTPDKVCWDFRSGPFARGCVYTWHSLGTDREHVEIINLFPRDNILRLGETVALFGTPLASALPCPTVNGNVYFRGNIIAVLPANLPRFGPDTEVAYLSFVSTRTLWYSANTPGWYGFHGRTLYRRC